MKLLAGSSSPMAISGGLVGYLGGVSTSTTTNTDNRTTNDQSNNVN